MLRELVIGMGLAGAVLLLIGTAGFCVAVARFRTTVTTAVGVALATLGAAGWGSFWAYLASPTLGEVFGWTVLALAAGTVGITCSRSAEARLALRSVLPALVLAFGVAVVTAGLFTLWGVDRDFFELARIRFSHYLPVDNAIPQMFLDRLVAGQDPRGFLPGYHSSDRPPLQTGLMAIVYPFTHALGYSEDVRGVSAGMLVEMTWMPGLAVLLRAIGARRRGVLAGMLFTGITGTVLVNTVFTWPKLLSAAMVLAGIALILQPVRDGGRLRPTTLGLAGVLLAFGMLSHGAALFALAIPVLFLLVRRRLAGLRALGALIGAAVACYLPWMLYSRFYDPPGTTLLSLHLAGVDPKPGDGGVVSELVGHYESIGLHTTLAYKWANLRTPFGLPPWEGLTLHGFDGPAQRATEFFTFSGAIGLGWLAAVLVLVAHAVRRPRHAGRDPYAVNVLLLMVFGLVSVVLWTTVMFGPATTVLHQGSHVFVLIALGAPIAWLADRMPRTGAVVLLLGLAWSTIVALPFVAYENHPGHTLPLSSRAIQVTVVGAVVVAAAFLLRGRLLQGRTRTSVEGPATVPAPRDAAARTGAPVRASADQLV